MREECLGMRGMMVEMEEMVMKEWKEIGRIMRWLQDNKTIIIIIIIELHLQEHLSLQFQSLD